MKSWRSALLLFTAGCAICADRPIADLLPAKTAVVFGVRVRPLLEALEAQGVLKDLPKQTAGFLPVALPSGFDPLHDVDEVVIAAAGTGQNPPALVIATGRFKAEKPGAVQHDAGSKQVHVFLDESTFLAGDLPLVEAALRASGGESHAHAALAERIEAMRSRYTLWGFADQLEKSGQKELESIDGFSFGAGMAHGFELGAEVHVRDPKDVEKLGAMLRAWEKMAGASSPGGVAPKLDIQTTHDTVKLAFSMTEEEIRKAIAAQRAAAKPAPPKPEVRAVPEVVSDVKGNTLKLTLPGKR